MTVYVALLRAVNVGGNTKLPMADLVRLAESAGFLRPETYIASGNLIFESAGSEEEVKAKLEDALADYSSKRIGVVIRTAAELAAVLAAHPFPDRAPNLTAVVFLNAPPPAELEVFAPDGEEVRVGTREIYVHYPRGMGRSKLSIPAAKSGTSRNLNTLTRLVTLSSLRSDANREDR